MEKVALTGDIALTRYEDRALILSDRSLRHDAGYRPFPDGDWLVSMYCPMPEVTFDMIGWWFWWHPQKSERYRAWFPGEHLSIKTAVKDRDYFSSPSLPPFQPNTQYPVERIGRLMLPLRIDFIAGEDAGFPHTDDVLVVCGHVGAFRGLVWHTEMAHIFFQEDDGLFLVSRFWLGHLLQSKVLRRMILTEDTARGMAEHCMEEYRNLGKMLPGLYRKSCMTDH